MLTVDDVIKQSPCCEKDDRMSNGVLWKLLGRGRGWFLEGEGNLIPLGDK